MAEIDYKKEYEESFNRAKEMHEQGMMTERLEYIFPSLKTYNDENTRKEIIEFFENYHDPILNSNRIKDKWIEWLEKQGEQKPVLDIEIPFGAKDSELQEASYYIPEGFHAEIDGNRVVIKRGEQNPAWSEEDEQYIIDTLNLLSFGCSSHSVNEVIDWHLNSLYDDLKKL